MSRSTFFQLAVATLHLVHQLGLASPFSPPKSLYPYTAHRKRDVGRHLYSQHEIRKGGLDTRWYTWSLQIEYSGSTFFQGWSFFDQADPSHGSVTYVGRDRAFQEGLAFWTTDKTPGIQVEHWSQKPVGSPRDSVRISSDALFAGGLFIIDLALMPWGCGVWPAFWLLGYGTSWPTAGEIDIIEGIQAMTKNRVTVHTSPGCTIDSTAGRYSGFLANPTCDSTTGGSGCTIVSPSDTSYGMPFNAAGGGVFACLWDGDGIKMWDWDRTQIPQDIAQETPDPKNWGTPAAAFHASTCDPYYFFHPQELVLNINLCGDWAGNTYSQYPYCPGTCADYIAKPNNVNNTVMLVNYIKVFQQSGAMPITSQADTNENETGAAGPVAAASGGSASSSARLRRKTRNRSPLPASLALTLGFWAWSAPSWG